MKFESWKDLYLFLLKYHNFSCLQCKYYSKKDFNPHDEHNRWEYARFFCPRLATVIHFSVQETCFEWTDEDGKKLDDYGETPVYRFSEEVIEKLSKIEGKVSIEEIDKIVAEEVDEDGKLQ